MNADFLISHQALEKKEGVGRGGYTPPAAGSAADRGGETCNGIARKFWPACTIWPIVDELKEKSGFPGTLDTDPRIRQATLDFYKHSFWDALGLDYCIDQAVADELYEEAVNMGTGTGGKNLQEALNFVNRVSDAGGVKLLWPDVEVDGRPGPVTMQAVSACAAAKRLGPLVDWMNVLQGEDLAAFMRRLPDQRVFAAGLVRRVRLTTSF